MLVLGWRLWCDKQNLHYCHHHHHHHHLLYHIVSVELLMNAVVIERDQSQSLGIDPHLDLGLLFLVMDLLVIIIMNDVHILVGRRRNSTSIIIVIDISKLLQHLKFWINNNPILCLLYQTVSVMCHLCVSVFNTFHIFFCSHF